MRQRLTYANLMATVAVFIALGGVSYAALKLPKNSVGAKQLKKNSVTGPKVRKNAVTGAKVKDQSLTGKDINLAQLGTVPSAQSANSLPPLEPTHIVGAPGEPGFENGSKNFTYPAPFQLKQAGFYKDHDGIVHLQGMVEVGTGAIVDSIFSLPPGFRPAASSAVFFNVACFGALGAECDTDSNGDDEEYSQVAITGSNTNLGGGLTLSGSVVGEDKAAVSLDGITFRAES
jgi:hypothetical protein